jgi:hypothetical protein
MELLSDSLLVHLPHCCQWKWRYGSMARASAFRRATKSARSSWSGYSPFKGRFLSRTPSLVIQKHRSWPSR